MNRVYLNYSFHIEQMLRAFVLNIANLLTTFLKIIIDVIHLDII